MNSKFNLEDKIFWNLRNGKTISCKIIAIVPPNTKPDIIYKNLSLEKTCKAVFISTPTRTEQSYLIQTLRIRRDGSTRVYWPQVNNLQLNDRMEQKLKGRPAKSSNKIYEVLENLEKSIESIELAFKSFEKEKTNPFFDTLNALRDHWEKALITVLVEQRMLSPNKAVTWLNEIIQEQANNTINNTEEEIEIG